MKTTVKKVYVETIDNGKVRMRAIPIRTPSGELMTRRLKRLIEGKIRQNYGSWCELRDEEAQIFTQHEVYYVGMIWKRPCLLLQELVQDRIGLQHELYKLEGECDLTRSQPCAVASNATNLEISSAILCEIELRKDIKHRIRELDVIMESHDKESALPTSYSW